MQIGHLIRKERLRQGRSLTELAALAGVKPESATSTESSVATIGTMNKIIGALGCRLTWKDYPTGQPIGAAIRLQRDEQKLSQVVLADRIGVTTRTLITLEKHSRGRMSVLRKLFKELQLKPKVLAKNRRLVPTMNTPEQDVVYTPSAMAVEIINHFSPEGVVLEPCVGSGNFFHALPDGIEKYYCEITENKDFFDWHLPVDWIISNPPWSQFRAFNIHAMEVANDIVWIIPLVHLSGKARIRDTRSMGFGVREILLLNTPKEWPQGGFQLAAVHLKRGFRGRIRLSQLL